MDKKTVLKGAVYGLSFAAIAPIGFNLGWNLGDKIGNRIVKNANSSVSGDKSLESDAREFNAITNQLKSRWLTKKQRTELTLKLKAVHNRIKAKLGKHYWKAVGRTAVDVDTWIDTFCILGIDYACGRAIGTVASKLINKIDKMPDSKPKSSSDTKKKTPPAKGKGGKK